MEIEVRSPAVLKEDVPGQVAQAAVYGLWPLVAGLLGVSGQPDSTPLPPQCEGKRAIHLSHVLSSRLLDAEAALQGVQTLAEPLREGSPQPPPDLPPLPGVSDLDRDPLIRLRQWGSGTASAASADLHNELFLDFDMRQPGSGFTAILAAVLCASSCPTAPAWAARALLPHLPDGGLSIAPTLAMGGQLGALHALVDAGQAMTPAVLLGAAWGGQEDIVQWLLSPEIGLRVDSVDEEYPATTALHAAALRGHAGVATLLMDAGANTGFTVVRNEDAVASPAHMAVSGGYLTLAEEILARGGTLEGASFAQHCTIPPAVSHAFVRRPFDPRVVEWALSRSTERDQLYGLHDAAWQAGNQGLVAALVWGKDSGLLGVDEQTLALAQAAQYGGEAACFALLEAGFPFNPPRAPGHRTREPVLVSAAGADRLGLVKELLRRGAFVDGSASGGYTALLSHLCRAKINREMIKVLLEAGADPNAVTPSGETALALLGPRKPKISKMLLDAGGNVTARTSYGRSVLCTTLISLTLSPASGLDTVRLLLAHGADLPDALRNMPPHCRQQVTPMLVKGGIDPQQRPQVEPGCSIM